MTTPFLTEFDIHLLAEGTHYRTYEKLGAHLGTQNGQPGTHFAVWAPNAEAVSVIGDFNDWAWDAAPMRYAGAGVWEAFVPGVEQGVEAERRSGQPCRFHHVFVHRISLEAAAGRARMKTTLCSQGQAMVGDNGGKPGDAGKQSLSATTEAGEVMRHNAAGEHSHIGVQDAATEGHRGVSPSGSQTAQLVLVARIVTPVAKAACKFVAEQIHHVLCHMLSVRSISEHHVDPLRRNPARLELFNQGRYVMTRADAAGFPRNEDHRRFSSGGNLPQRW